MPFDFACPDWADRLRRGETPIADLPLDQDAAERAVGIFNKLRLPDVPGQPELREAAGDWQRDIVRAIFGSMETSPGVPEVRRVGEVFILVPKKNAKTTSAAAIALTFMLLNQRKNADMLIIGPTQKISDVAFEQAAGMIRADEFLQTRLHIQDHKKTIRDRTTNARLMIRTFGMDVLTGAKPIFALIDEIHLLGTVAYAADVIRQIRGGMLPFPESVLVMITTQSDHPPAGVFKSELDYARNVRDGKVTERVRLLPVLYEFPVEIQASDDKAWTDPALWHMVTPNLGRSISLDALRDGFARAEQDGTHELIAWATQHLNVEVGVAIHGDSWAGAMYWADAYVGEPLTLQGLLDRSEVAAVGVDVGGLDDLSAAAVIGRDKETGAWLHWVRAWAQPEVFERRKDIVSKLIDFEAQGDLVICAEPDQDAREIAEICATVKASGLMPASAGVGTDAAKTGALLEALAAVGIVAPQVTAVGQGWKLQNSIVHLPRRIRDRTFLHCGQPIMAWAVSNAKEELRGSNKVITKQTAGAAKIDPLMATFNAAQLMFDNPQAPAPQSYLQTADLVVL